MQKTEVHAPVVKPSFSLAQNPLPPAPALDQVAVAITENNLIGKREEPNPILTCEKGPQFELKPKSEIKALEQKNKGSKKRV